MSKEFELARLQMVRAARAEEIDNIRGYAWSHRIYPFNPYELEEAFEKDFKISRDASEEVLKAIDDGWRNNKLVSFYDLEGWPGRSDGLGRMEIFHVCRLAFLDRRFDDAVWQALTIPGSGPETIILANVDGNRKTDNRARQPNSRQQRPNLLTPRQLPCRRTSRTDGLCSRYCRAVEKGCLMASPRFLGSLCSFAWFSRHMTVWSNEIAPSTLSGGGIPFTSSSSRRSRQPATFTRLVGFTRGDKQTAAELSQMKGQIVAVEQASIAKKCNIEFQGKPPA